MESWTRLLVGQGAVPGLAAEGPLAHHVERLLGHAHGAHGVVDPATAEAGLGDGEGLALAAQEPFGQRPARCCSG